MLLSIDPSRIGSIETCSECDQEGNVINVTGEWKGGDFLQMSYEFLESLDPRWGKREGNIITLLYFKMKIVDDDPYKGMVTALRVDDVSS